MKDGSPAFDKRKLQGGAKVKPKPSQWTIQNPWKILLLDV